MFKREIKPLSEAMSEGIAKSINKLQYVDEAANRPADREEGDTKSQDISSEEEVKSDGSATQAPKRKADKSGAEPMQKVAEEVEELDENITKMSHARLKFHMNNKSVPHGSYSWDQMKAERDRRLKAGEGEAYKNAKASMSEEVEVLDESKALLKDYQDMKAQGKKDHNILDALMSMPKYKKMSRDQMAKVIGDAKRKGIFKEDIEITELHMSLLEAHGIEKKVAEKVKKVFDAMSSEDKAAFMKAYLKNPKAATEYMFKDMKKMAKEEVELEEAALNKMEKMALKSALGFGGTAEPSHLKVIEKLKKMGLVDEIEKQTDVAGTVYYYSLTKKGKEQAKAIKEEVELEEAMDKKYLDKAMDIINSRITKPGQKPKHPSYDKAPADIKTAAEKLARNLMKESMDPVNPNALKGKHSERKDKDIDNDGDVDSSDEYLHKRRKAISKALAKEEVELDEKYASAKPKFKEGDIVKVEGEKSTYTIVGVGSVYNHPQGKFRNYELLKVTLDKDGNPSGRGRYQQTGFYGENQLTLVKRKG